MSPANATSGVVDCHTCGLLYLCVTACVCVYVCRDTTSQEMAADVMRTVTSGSQVSLHSICLCTVWCGCQITTACHALWRMNNTSMSKSTGFCHQMQPRSILYAGCDLLLHSKASFLAILVESVVVKCNSHTAFTR